MTTKIKALVKPEWACRWNLRKEHWERTEKGQSEWREYNRTPQEDYRLDEKFVEVWCEVHRDGGSRSDVARIFCKKDRHVSAKRKAINKKLADQFKLDSSHEVLPNLPALTSSQVARRDSHFTEKVKVLTLKDKVLSMSRLNLNVLDLQEWEYKK